MDSLPLSDILLMPLLNSYQPNMTWIRLLERTTSNNSSYLGRSTVVVNPQDGLLCRELHGIKGQPYCMTPPTCLNTRWMLSRFLLGSFQWVLIGYGSKLIIILHGKRDFPALASLGDRDKVALNFPMSCLLREEKSISLSLYGVSTLFLHVLLVSTFKMPSPIHKEGHRT